MQIRRWIRYRYLKLLRIKDNPAKLAQGISVGIGIDFLPLPIISIPISFIIAKIIRANAPAAALTAAFLKPLVPVFYVINYQVGSLLLGETPPSDIAPEPPVEIFSMKGIIDGLLNASDTFLWGAAFNAVVIGFISFYVLHSIIHMRHQRRELKKNRNLLKQAEE